MTYYKISLIVTTFVIMSVFALASTTFALSGGSPQGKADQAPYGLKVEGDAAGAKLKGVMEVSFSEIDCRPNFGTDNCDPANSAVAMVAMRLSLPSIKKETHVQAFYVNLGAVAYDDLGAVQDKIISKLRNEIVNAFFDEDIGQQIYLKEFALYALANAYEKPVGAPPVCSDFPECYDPTVQGYPSSDTVCDICDDERPKCYDTNSEFVSPLFEKYDPFSPDCPISSYLEFTAIADITLAVNTVD